MFYQCYIRKPLKLSNYFHPNYKVPLTNYEANRKTLHDRKMITCENKRLQQVQYVFDEGSEKITIKQNNK